MKKMSFVAILITSLVFSGNSASASTKPALILKGFQMYVANAKSALNTSKTNYDASVAAINVNYGTSVATAKATFEKEISTA